MKSHSEQDPLKRSIALLWSAFGRNCTEETRSIWAQSLKPHDGPALMRVFRECTEQDSLPTLGELLGKVRALRKSAEAAPEPKLTDAERKRSDQAAIMSMLWLHYAKGWRLEAFAGDTLARLFGADPTEALRKAAEIYDKATVLRWMKDQQRAGN